ncbi:ABC transporter ATP-binding protein, partial [Campylobacter jejuni]|nr:ABC transporter ATP-binding protein [Campylobacter jejuni]
EKDALALRKKWGVGFSVCCTFLAFLMFMKISPLPLKEYTHLDENSIQELVLMKLMVGLNESVLKQFPSELSGGMQKRV